jgi:hypothetical protein
MFCIRKKNMKFLSVYIPDISGYLNKAGQQV